MKILITADLHHRRDWYNWLLQQAHTVDAIAIAGDLLDMRFDITQQIAFVTHWAQRMSCTGTLIFLCDGNHDGNAPSILNSLSNDLIVLPSFGRWMDTLGKLPNITVSGESKLLHDNAGQPMIVTCAHYEPASESPNKELFDAGFKLKQANSDAPWIVLHHEPPKGLLSSAVCAAPYLPGWISDYQPDFICCGHDHSSPLQNGFCTERRGKTLVINPGQRADEAFPSHVILDTRSGQTQWRV